MGFSPNSGGVSLRTFNRNFAGRTGTKGDQAYLVSPETAVAVALTGCFTDPRTLDIEYPEIADVEEFLINDNMIRQPESGTEIIRKPTIGEPPMNFLRRKGEKGCILIGSHTLDLSKKLGDGIHAYEGKEIVFGFRPEAIVLGEAENAYAIQGTVELTEMLGDNANVYMDVDENKAILKVTPHEIPALDSEIVFSVPVEHVYLFDAETEKVIHA